MVDKLTSMEGYNEEDYNPYWEAAGSLEEARASLYYVLEDLKNE
jgi:hypothetical protein